MSQVVWKYQLYNSLVFFRMPKDSKILCVQMQDNVPTIWVLCDPDADKRPYQFIVVPTGAPIEYKIRSYIGSVQSEDGLVFHIFETE